MILKNCDFKTFFNRVHAHSLYCYGIGSFFEKTILNFAEFPWGEKLGGLIDNNVYKQGKEKQVFGAGVEIFSLEKFLKLRKEDSVILITCVSYYEIVEQLNQIKELEQTECYIYFFMCNLSMGEPVSFLKEEPFKIPPVIHYCWFGNNPLPDLYKRCIESWHKYCPDYEIIEWNEKNCDMKDNLYSKQAYEVGKYGFVPDYFRLKIIYENGGIYLDTDVELIKNLDDLRHEEAFCGLQYPGQVALGLGFGAMSGNQMVRELMRTYESIAFIKEDGSMNETASPFYQTNDLIRSGMKYGNKQQYVEGMCIYPTEVLSPINIYVNTYEITGNTYAIHHFDGSWVSRAGKEKKSRELQQAQKLAEMFC